MTHPADQAITLEQYRRLNLTRPLTDGPVGGATAGKRHADADASAVFTTAESPIPADGRVRRGAARTMRPGGSPAPSACDGVRGTQAGYQRHVRAGESACDECRVGLAAYRHTIRPSRARRQAP